MLISRNTLSFCYSKTEKLEMWANAQRDGRLPNTGGALCSAPQFDYAVMLPRCETC